MNVLSHWTFGFRPKCECRSVKKGSWRSSCVREVWAQRLKYRTASLCSKNRRNKEQVIFSAESLAKRYRGCPSSEIALTMMADDPRLLGSGFLPSRLDVVCGRDNESIYHGKRLFSSLCYTKNTAFIVCLLQ